MNLQRRPVRNKIAFVLAILDGILLLFTLFRHALGLKSMLGPPLIQLLTESAWWAAVAETLFYCAILVTLYGLLSIWMPDLRIILWSGLSLVVIAGLHYLVSAVLFYQEEGIGVPIQQGLFMFIISLLFPLLAIKVLRRARRKPSNQVGW